MYKKIQKAFESKNIVWRKHALIRMLERNLARNDVFKAIYNRNIIETYPDIKPYPGYLVFGPADEKMLHVVISWDENAKAAYVVTAYIPDTDHFHENGETGKEKKKMMFTQGCPLYSGELYEGASTFTVDKQQALVVVRNVPARVCRQCGESWILDDAAEKLEQIVCDAKLKHSQLEVIVWRLKEKGFLGHERCP